MPSETSSLKKWWELLQAALAKLPGGQSKPATLREIRQGASQGVYGRVNASFSEGWSVLEKDIRACAAAKINWGCELTGWTDDAGTWNNPVRRQAVFDILPKAVKLCRDLNIYAVLKLFNDNMGKRAGPTLAQAWAEALGYVNLVRSLGPANMVVNPVGETQTSAGSKMENYCATALAGYILMYNGSGGHPQKTPAGYRFREWHPYHVSDRPGLDAVVCSDTTTIILELCGALDGAGNPTAIEQWVAAMSGHPLIFFYHYKRRAHDAAAIKAVGKAVR